MKKSLAASAGVVESPAKTGTGLTTLPETSVPTVVKTGPDSTPYINFAHPMSKQWGKLCSAIPGLEEGEPVLVFPEPKRPVRLSPFRFHLLTAFQFWGQNDPVDFALNAARITPPEDGEKRQWAENIEAVLLVYHDGKLYPASASFRTTKCGAAHRAIDAGRLAANTEEWGAQSPEHRLTMGVPVHWARYVAQYKTGPVRTSKGSGYKYHPTAALIFPSSAAELKAVSDSFNDEAFMKALNAVKSRFDTKCDDVKRLVK